MATADPVVPAPTSPLPPVMSERAHRTSPAPDFPFRLHPDQSADEIVSVLLHSDPSLLGPPRSEESRVRWIKKHYQTPGILISVMLCRSSKRRWVPGSLSQTLETYWS